MACTVDVIVETPKGRIIGGIKAEQSKAKNSDKLEGKKFKAQDKIGPREAQKLIEGQLE